MLPASVRRAFHLALRRHATRASDVDEEIAFHLQERIDALVNRGWSPDDAAIEARRRFGDATAGRHALIAAAHQRDRRLDLFERLQTVGIDLKIASRQLARSPGFTLGTIAAFALGIGANATMFSVVDRLLLRPPPHIAAPNDVYTLSSGTYDALSFPAFIALHDHLAGVASVAAQTSPWPFPVGRGEQSRMAQTVFVDGDYFKVLGVRPLLGRGIATGDARLPDGQSVAVIGYALWQRQFNGDSSVVGRDVMVSTERVRIIGVAPNGFNGPGTRPVDLWVPLSLMNRLQPFMGHALTVTMVDAHFLRPIVRVAQHAAPEQVAKRATMLLHAALADRPGADTAVTVVLHSVLPSRAAVLSPEARVASLLGAVSVLVLLIACSNAANLMLARAIRRRREIAIRVALGVSRRRLVASLLADSLLLSGAGGIVAVVVAALGATLMRNVLLEGFAWAGAVIDARTIAFIIGTTVLAGLCTGFVPALVLLRRSDLSRAMGEGRHTGSVHRHRIISALVIAQTVLSATLLIGALLFVQSLTRVRAVPLGLDMKHTVVVSLEALTLRASGTDRLFDELQSAVARAPGVASVAVAEGLPFGKWYLSTKLGVPGRDADSPSIKDGGYLRAVTSAYFATVGTHILQGRAFVESDDRATGERLAIVSVDLAHALWPAGDAVGHCLRLGADSMPCLRIVGVAEGTHESAVERAETTSPWAHIVYVPLSQGRHTMGSRVVVARITAPPATAIGRVRSAVQSVDPSMPLADVWLMQSRHDPELRPWTLGATMFGVFGALALLLAALGLYTVISYSVTQRTQEMGIRIALGAQSRHILALVGAQGAVLAGVGIVVAAVASAALAPVVQPLLFQTSARSIPIYALVSGGLLFVALLASLVPAVRASRVNPITVMRAD